MLKKMIRHTIFLGTCLTAAAWAIAYAIPWGAFKMPMFAVATLWSGLLFLEVFDRVGNRFLGPSQNKEETS